MTKEKQTKKQIKKQTEETPTQDNIIKKACLIGVSPQQIQNSKTDSYYWYTILAGYQAKATTPDKMRALIKKIRVAARLRRDFDVQCLGHAEDFEDVVEAVEDLLPFWLAHETVCPEEAKAMMHSVRSLLVIFKEFEAMPKLPVDWIGLQEWLIDFDPSLGKATKEPKHLEKETTKCSLPLKIGQWCDIFRVSENTLRGWMETDDYHFRRIGGKNGRRWVLPEKELPAEYLQKFKETASPDKPKTQ